MVDKGGDPDLIFDSISGRSTSDAPVENGENVIVSWRAAGDELDESAARLDEAVSATVAGA